MNNIQKRIIDEFILTFGEENVQGIVLGENKDKVMNVDESNKNYVDITVLLPDFTIKGSQHSTRILGMVMLLRVDTKGNLARLDFNRTKYTLKQYLNGYNHSHLGAMTSTSEYTHFNRALYGKSVYHNNSFCFGDGDNYFGQIRAIISYGTKDEDALIEAYGMFAEAIVNVLSVESRAGGAYKYISNIRGSDSIQIPLMDIRNYDVNLSDTRILINLVNFIHMILSGYVDTNIENIHTYIIDKIRPIRDDLLRTYSNIEIIKIINGAILDIISDVSKVTGLNPDSVMNLTDSYNIFSKGIIGDDSVYYYTSNVSYSNAHIPKEMYIPIWFKGDFLKMEIVDADLESKPVPIVSLPVVTYLYNLIVGDVL